jgi:hypothetical protein
MGTMIATLERAGLDPAQATAAYGTLHTFTIGFAALSVARSAPSSRHPVESEPYRILASFTADERFDKGIDYLLRGILGEK